MFLEAGYVSRFLKQSGRGRNDTENTHCVVETQRDPRNTLRISRKWQR